MRHQTGRMHTALRVALLGAFATVGLRAQDPDAADDALLADATTRLAAIGYDVPDTVRIEDRSSKEVIADLEAQQELFLPADSFTLQHALLKALGLPAGRSAKVLRQQTLAGMARGLSAYYDPIRKVFVELPSRARELSESLSGGPLPLFVHELVHAHQDAREGGMKAWFGGEGRTLDNGLARRCAAEGEAEVAAVLALQREDALAAFEHPSTSGGLDRLLAGELTGLIYESGRRFAAVRYRQGGLDAVRALWAQPPASTEQVLHPGKYGADMPTAVALPNVPGLAAAHSTTVGELVLLQLLRQSKVGRLDASLAAAGWDGDRVVVFDRGDEAGVAVAWRSVWDRDEDAADFAARLAVLHTGVVVQQQRIVDWCQSDDEDLQGAIVDALESDRQQPPVDDAAAASTAAAEDELRAELGQTRVEDGVWRHGALGLSVPIPDGWQVQEINGVPMLVHQATAETGFALTLNVMAGPNPDAIDLAAIVAANRAQLEQMHATIDTLAVVSRGGRDVVEGEYHGRIGSPIPMHFLALAFLRGDQQVWVTATATEKLWTEHGDRLRALLAGITIDAEAK